jgi:hypothetical protein
MSFPVYSTSYETDAIKRIIRVLRRADRIASLIGQGEVFNCRRIAGSTSWSQHAWGNAIDLFPRAPASDDDHQRYVIAHWIVWQATHRTRVNRMRPLPVAEVIDHDARVIWTPARGWHRYTGTTGDHVHVSGFPLMVGTPPCAR